MPERKSPGVSKRNTYMSEQRLRGNGNMFQELNWFPYNISILVIFNLNTMQENFAFDNMLQYRVSSIGTRILKT